MAPQFALEVGLGADYAELGLISLRKFDVNDRDQMTKIVMSCVGTKFTDRFGNLLVGKLVSIVQA